MKNAKISIVTATRGFGFSLFCKGILLSTKSNITTRLELTPGTLVCLEEVLVNRANGLVDELREWTYETVAYTRIKYLGASEVDGRWFPYVRPFVGCIDDSSWPISLRLLGALDVGRNSSEYTYVLVRGDNFCHLFELSSCC
jgi:hypothetical protein